MNRVAVLFHALAHILLELDLYLLPVEQGLLHKFDVALQDGGSTVEGGNVLFELEFELF